jgi:hypothetical protein
MTTTTRRDWTSVGQELLNPKACPLGHNWTIKEVFERAVDDLQWVEVDDSGPVVAISVGLIGNVGGGLFDALAINAAIRELRIPRVTRIAVGLLDCWSVDELGPLCYGLLGIEGNYTNGTARVYIVDRGSDLLPIASDFTPAEPERKLSVCGMCDGTGVDRTFPQQPCRACDGLGVAVDR